MRWGLKAANRAERDKHGGCEQNKATKKAQGIRTAEPQSGTVQRTVFSSAWLCTPSNMYVSCVRVCDWTVRSPSLLHCCAVKRSTTHHTRIRHAGRDWEAKRPHKVRSLSPLPWLSWALKSTGCKIYADKMASSTLAACFWAILLLVTPRQATAHRYRRIIVYDHG